MRNKHIFVGGKDDIFLVQANAQVGWHVQKEAEVGDQGFFLLPQPMGFYAFGQIASEPEFDGNSHTGYTSLVDVLLILKQNVQLRPVQTKFDEWLAIQHPTIWNHSIIIKQAFYFDDLYAYICNEQGYGGDSELRKLRR